MSFDLYFCRQNASLPSVAELKEYFASLPFCNVQETDDDGVQFWYQNEATGVYCNFLYSPLDVSELEGCGSSGLSFNLNFNRPSFFAYETMPLVEAFSKRFDLVVEDPQAETVGPAEANNLIASWRSSNARATSALVTQTDVETHYLPEPTATQWWRYMSVRQTIEKTITEDIFIPQAFILMAPTQHLFTMTVWPNTIAQFFPTCDYLYVGRNTKRLFGTREEAGLVAYEEAMKVIAHLLDELEVRDFRIKYLPPENTAEAAPLVQKLHLKTIDLSQHTRMGPDGFHDVTQSS